MREFEWKEMRRKNYVLCVKKIEINEKKLYNTQVNPLSYFII